MPRYFSGTSANMGIVTALPHLDWPALLENLFSKPVQLHVTKKEYHLLPKKEQNKIKSVGYITPCTFRNATSPRKYEHAGPCNLLCLDIDDAGDSKRCIDDNFAGLGKLAHAVWHTASSTDEAPRLRVIVHAEAIAVGRYASAVKTLAGMLGVRHVTTESLVPVQPMYLPVRFKEEVGA